MPNRSVLLNITKGFNSSAMAFTGPVSVQIDTSNPCNLKCICCWTYSPLVKIGDSEFLRRKLTFQGFREIIDDLKMLNTCRIILAGVGDPLTHPRIDEMVEYAKCRGMEVGVTTNGTLLSVHRLKRWITAKVDWINISMLGATEATWKKMHPLDNTLHFSRLLRSLRVLRSLKRSMKSSVPGVTLSHILCNLTVNDAPDAVRVGHSNGVDSVAFYSMDTFPEIASLELKVQELAKLRHSLLSGLRLAEKLGIETNIQTVLDTVNWNGDQGCVGQRMPKTPCYHGWTFARIMADGSVFPCCGSVGRVPPLGNIHERSFKDIWYSKSYNSFRHASKFLWDEDQRSFRQEMGCEFCPDVEANLEYHSNLSQVEKQSSKR